MKKILSLSLFLLCSIVLLAQRPKTETFRGQVGNIPGPETSAPVTFTVDNTSGYCTFKSDGNGKNVGNFFWRGQIPAAVNQPLSNPGAVWTGQLAEWSDMTISERKNGSRTNTQTRLRSVKQSNAAKASIYGMTSDGKSITLQIRIPYLMDGYSDPVQITFSCTLDLSSGQKSPARSSDNGGGVRMPTGNTDISDVNYGNGITVGIVGGGGGGSSASAARASVGGVSFALAPGYSVAAREKLADGEACMITPDNNPDNDRLILKIHPNALRGVNGLTDEEVGDMLADKVDAMAGVLANTGKSGLKLDNPYKIYFDNNEDGSYFPHCYSYVNGTGKDGSRTLSYTEAALVGGKIVSGTAIASTKAEEAALIDIYLEAVQAAAGK
ncbi:MAG: hypothetical protein IJV37_02445 [Bacteroidales bacterium]|nr:hypothetical protein [Bacteroidales bacterium]